MKRLRALAVTSLALFLLLCIAESSLAANEFGKLTGIVADPAGTPQMGATIWLSPETVGGRTIPLLSDQNGVFLSQRLRPGLYSLKAILPGFLPSIQQHISVSANLTTLVRIELDSVFSSLDQLRRQPAQPSQADDWKWVLRASTASRPVLQLLDGTVVIREDPQEASGAADSQRKHPHTRVEMTTGSSRPGSSSGIPGALGTAVSYDQSLGGTGKLLLAGEMKYNQEPGNIAGGALASIWVPSGEIGRGPETTVVLRQIRFGWDGRTIRAMRFEHSEQVAVGHRLMIHYGGEYLTAGVSRTMVSSLRPHAEIAAELSPHWSAQFLLETDADSYGLSVRGAALETAIEALQTTPRMLWSGNRPVLAGGWHEEFSVRRTIGSRASIEEAAFHDLSRHQAVFGFGPSSGARAAFDVFPFFARPRGLDGGADSSWGTRIVYRERLVGSVELAAIYAWAGALAPDGNVKPLSDVDGMLSTRYRHSVATRLSGKVPRVGTQFAASYKWVNGTAVSRQDLFGEAAMAIDPNLSLSVRQPLPSFHAAGHWEALADFRNMLSQGYVSLEGQNGRILLVPVDRSFRGGVSFQF